MKANGSAQGGKPKATLGKDKGGHSVPDFLTGGDSAKTWERSTGYTSESKMGPGGNGRVITLAKP
jgi:hypothetical protein